jgi:hypothetical protein
MPSLSLFYFSTFPCPNSADNTQMIAKWLAGLIDEINHKRPGPNSALSSFVIQSLKEKDFVHYDPIVG